MTTALFTLELLFADPRFAGIDASPLQRALCRACEGQPIGADVLGDEAVLEHFGCERSSLGLVVPVIVALVAGVRGGKSFFATCGAVHDVLEADVSRLKPHEIARHAIVAPTVDNAAATFRILRGIVEGSPVLRRMLDGEPTEDTLMLRRPDGRLFEIVVVAAHRGGTTLRSRWLAGATLEETALFGIESSGAAVNAEELLRAAEGRLLPRTQIRIVSSPMGRQGLLYEIHRQHFGKPGRVLVVHAPTRALNPSFPQATIDAVRARDPDAAAREHDARWIDGDTTFLHTQGIDASVRLQPEVRPPDRRGSSYAAAMDAATRGNAWTLAVARQVPLTDGRVEVSLAREWIGSKEKPLSPKATFAAIATALGPYGVTEIACDKWAFDANQDHARDAGLELVEVSTSEQNEAYAVLQTLASSSQLELPRTEHVASDLKMLRKVLTPTGFKIVLPKTPDGRHCDFAPSVALAVAHAQGRSSPGNAMIAALEKALAGERGEFEVSDALLEAAQREMVMT